MAQSRQADGAPAQVPVAVPPGIERDPGVVEVDDFYRVQSRPRARSANSRATPGGVLRSKPAPWAWAVSRHKPRGTPLAVMIRERCSKRQPNSWP